MHCTLEAALSLQETFLAWAPPLSRLLPALPWALTPILARSWAFAPLALR